MLNKVGGVHGTHGTCVCVCLYINIYLYIIKSLRKMKTCPIAKRLRDIWGRWEAWEFGNVWREGSTSEESEKDKNHR